MKRIIAILLLVVFTLSLVACSKDGSGKDAIKRPEIYDMKILSVNGEDITYEFYRYYYLFVKQSYEESGTEITEEKIKEDVLNKLLYDGAVHKLLEKYSLSLTKDEIKGRSIELSRPGAVITKAEINGKKLDAMLWAPYIFDLTDLLKEGENIIRLELTSCFRNLLGPLHLGGESYVVTPGTFNHASKIFGGMKGRANQVCCAIGRDQLKHYDERCVKIREAMNYFWDQLEGLPGIRAIRVDESTGSNMAGWYCPHGTYKPEELHGLSVKRFAEAVRAEIGGICYEGGNYCLHTHNFFNSFDLTNCGAPSRIAHNDHDVRADDHLCDPSLEKYCFSIPRFNYLDKEVIDLYAAGYRKVIENHMDLLENDAKEAQGGHWYGSENH